MAHLLGTQSVAAMAGSRRLLESVDVGLDDGSRVGILGPNGAGKSTLLRIVAGIQEPDGGVVTRRDGLRVAVLSQADALDPADTVAAAVHPGRAEYEWASDPRVRDIHEGLLASVPIAAAVGALSGGQRRRVALARVLAADADIVCLDEPTNHLDVEGVAWLARHLNARFARPGASGALLAVTHDRWFLDAVCEHIWEVVPGVDPGGKRPQIPGRVEIYDGSYAAYTLARAERARQAGVAARKRANLLTKELAWLRRGAPARTSKPKFHIAAAEALIADAPPPRDSVELVEMASARLGKDVIDLEDVSVSFTRPDFSRLDVLRGVTWRLAPGERVGVVGVNGAGKTTVLNLLRGEVEPTGGRVRRGKTVKVATLSQETRELDAVAGMRVVEAVADIAQVVVAGGKEITAQQMTERMGFTRERAHTRVKEISGGERRRLQLMRLLMSQPNVLLLDEPTNDLDTDTLAAMEDLLDSFAGTLVVVSHDRYLLERVTDHQVALLGDGTLRALPGGVEQYLQMRRDAVAGPSQSSGPIGAAGGAGEGAADGAGGGAGPGVAAEHGGAASGSGNAAGGTRGAADGGAAPAGAGIGARGPHAASAAQRRAAKKEADRLDRRITRLRGRAAELEGELGALAVQAASDPGAVDSLARASAEHQRVLDEIDGLEEAWLEAAELLE